MTSTADNAAVEADYSAIDLALIDPISHHSHAETSAKGEVQDE